MEEEKETSEEKEEEEEQLHHHHMAASSVDQQDLPIMHWEDLSQRIAELEKQEQERTKRATGVRTEDEEEDFRRCRVAVVTSRFSSHRNLQLCFINDSDSDSDEDDEGREKKVAVETRHNGCHAAGLKQEVATALRTLRDELLAEQKEQEHLAGSSVVSQRKHLERWELQQCSVQQLCSLKASLQRDVHALSSELVAHLLVRDQLRTKQDAMLLDVQDLT